MYISHSGYTSQEMADNIRRPMNSNPPQPLSPANTAQAYHQTVSERSTNPIEAGSNNATQGGSTSNLITEENAPHSSRMGTPMQESLASDRKPMAL